MQEAREWSPERKPRIQSIVIVEALQENEEIKV